MPNELIHWNRGHKTWGDEEGMASGCPQGLLGVPPHRLVRAPQGLVPPIGCEGAPRAWWVSAIGCQGAPKAWWAHPIGCEGVTRAWWGVTP